MVSVAERSAPKGMFMHKELSVKIRVRGDFHARFCERVRVKLPRSTRPMILLNTEAGDTACIFFKFSEDTAVLHKVKTPTAAGIKTCHCDSRRVYAEMNDDGEKLEKGR